MSSSSRRAKKGPGRRPLSRKRQRFMELRAQGWSIRGAAREVGVSRTAANNWSRGYTVYRDGAAVRFVEPLDRLAVRQISARYLSEQERIEIADLHHEGIGVREIAHRIGRAPSTVSRELRRNRTVGRRAGYRPFEAHRRACGRRARVRDRRIQTTLNSLAWSRSCCSSAGARSRSAVTCASDSLPTRRCGCPTRASTTPSTSRDRR